MARLNSSILWLSLFVIAAGCYGGNALIAVGQGLLVLSIVGAAFISFPEESREWPGRKIPVSTWMIVGLLVVAVLSVFANLDSYDQPLRDLKKLRHLAIPLLLLLIPSLKWRILAEAPRLGKLIWMTLMGAAVLVTVADMINLVTGFHPLLPVEGVYRYGRLGGVFGMVMTYGYSIQFTLLVILGVLWLFWKQQFCGSRALFLFTALALVICSAGLYLSGSRGAMLGVGVGGLLLIILAKSKWIYFSSVGLVIAATGYLLATDSALLKKKLNDESRLAQWKTAMVTGMKHPVFGIGYRQFEKQCRDLKMEYGFPKDTTMIRGTDGETERVWMHSNAHNNYLEAFASTGVFGLFALLGFLVCWLREVWRKEVTRILFAPAILGFLVAGWFENSFTDGEITTLVMLFYVGSQFMLMMDLEKKTEGETHER